MPSTYVNGWHDGRRPGLQPEMSAFPAHPAWEFVTGFYSTPGVAPACLALQERHAIDVTAVLFSLWCSAVDARPLGPNMAPLTQAARERQQATVLPIRATRRWLKDKGESLSETAGAAFYKTVLAAEIDCEHGELLMLAQLADSLCGSPSGTGTPAVVAPNVGAFLLASGVAPGEQDCGAIAAILTEAGASEDIGRVLPALSTPSCQDAKDSLP
jgi:uncharacterized protein (TIGR02444 family)